MDWDFWVAREYEIIEDVGGLRQAYLAFMKTQVGQSRNLVDDDPIAKS